MLSKRQVEKFSKHFKIDHFTIYREYLQILFLKYFYTLKETDQVYFKGGTAIRLLLDSFRFSEDLDFTSLLEIKEMKRVVDRALKGVQKEVDVEFKRIDSPSRTFTGKIYQNIEEFSFPLTVRLDFSMREEPQFVENSVLETIFPVSPYPRVSNLAPKEMLAEKVRAILSRESGRDLFDLWFLLSKKVELDWKLVNIKMEIYNRKANSQDLIEAIKERSKKEIESDLNKFLPRSERDLSEKVKDLILEKIS